MQPSIFGDLSPVIFLKGLAIAGAFIAMFTDMRWGKIYNWLTFPLIAVGLALNAWLFGWNGLGMSLAGTIMGGIFYLGVAYIGAFGMGDVKLMAAIGALGGIKFVVSAFLYTSAIGIPHALFIQFLNYGRNAPGMLLTSLVTQAFLEKNIQNDNATLKYHYYLGIDILLGTLLAFFIEIPLGF